jgi:3-isopropylmalate dehydrogenase
MSVRAYTVACLAGDGIGPEVMAEASRALAAVSYMHGFVVDELHVPFGGEALLRSGEALPPSTRSAYLTADAVLVAAPRDPALTGIEAELDLRAALTCVRFAPHGDIVVLSPLTRADERWTVDRAFALARARRGRVASVHADRSWRSLVEEAAEANDAILVEHLSASEGLPALAFETERFDVVVTGSVLGGTVADLAASSVRGPRVVASARLAAHGPSVFAPAHGAARQIAGQGVANPSSMLLATALLLAEGLGERGAAATLQGAVVGAVGNGRRTADLVRSGVAATTREFTAAVLAMLPASVTNVEFHREARP